MHLKVIVFRLTYHTQHIWTSYQFIVFTFHSWHHWASFSLCTHPYFPAPPQNLIHSILRGEWKMWGCTFKPLWEHPLDSHLRWTWELTLVWGGLIVTVATNQECFGKSIKPNHNLGPAQSFYATCSFQYHNVLNDLMWVGRGTVSLQCLRPTAWVTVASSEVKPSESSRSSFIEKSYLGEW